MVEALASDRANQPFSRVATFDGWEEKDELVPAARCPHHRAGPRRVPLRNDWTRAGAEPVLSAERASRHQRYVLTPLSDNRHARDAASFPVNSVKPTLSPARHMPPVRRLAAILASDVAGYSRLMGTDEEGTHERLKAHLRELVDPKIGEHRGRIVKNTGDGFLAEFSSVVDAVRCAVEVQRGMIDREPQVPDERRIRFRIGINLGDVIAEADDIYGDGVNVAARLEALAEPGGVCISRVVRDQIRDKLPYPFEDRGEQTVKNIARPVRVFALRPEAGAELPMANAPIAVPRRRRSIVPQVAGTTVAAVLVIAVIAWWIWPVARNTPTPVASIATSTTTSVAQPRVAPRLSIVVLPFSNLSSDPDQQYLADGITEDLTTDLSRLPDLFVISRNNAFTYRNKSDEAGKIGRELGVRYLLEGSVRQSGNKVRVNTQLIAADSGAHLWAERFDREADETVGAAKRDHEQDCQRAWHSAGPCGGRSAHREPRCV